MAAYRLCGLAACTPVPASGLTLGKEYGEPLLFYSPAKAREYDFTGVGLCVCL